MDHNTKFLTAQSVANEFALNMERAFDDAELEWWWCPDCEHPIDVCACDYSLMLDV